MSRKKLDTAAGCSVCGDAINCPYPEARCPTLHPEVMTREHREARDAAIRQAKAGGMSDAGIAAQFALHPRTVRKVLERSGRP